MSETEFARAQRLTRELGYANKVIGELQAKVDELTTAEDVAIWGEYTQGTITDLQARVDELEGFRAETERQYQSEVDKTIRLQAKANELTNYIDQQDDVLVGWRNKSSMLEGKVDRLTAALVKCNQAAISDPHDERDIDVHWLQNVILSTTNAALKQEVK